MKCFLFSRKLKILLPNPFSFATYIYKSNRILFIMFKGIGSVPAVNPLPSYSPPQHHIVVSILIYLNCFILIGGGGVSFFFACVKFKYLSHCFISLYMVIFGIISIMGELRLAIAQKAFGFACCSKGLAFLFIFCGTLGISFGISKSASELVPFISGVASVGVGVILMMEPKPAEPGTVENLS